MSEYTEHEMHTLNDYWNITLYNLKIVDHLLKAYKIVRFTMHRWP